MPTNISPRQIIAMKDAMCKKSRTNDELGEIVGLSRKRVERFLRTNRDLFYISSWVRIGGRGQYRAKYSFGSKKNAAKPRTKPVLKPSNKPIEQIASSVFDLANHI